MSENDKNEMIDEFMECTGVLKDRAEHYLQSTNWTLQLAVQMFYAEVEGDDDDNDNSPLNAVPTIDGAAMEIEPSSDAKVDRVSFMSPDAGKEKSSSTSSTKDGKKNNTASTSASTSSKPRIITLDEIRSKSDSDDENEPGQAFYAGGSDTSGQQILGPPKRRDFVSDIFRASRLSGAVAEDQDGGPSSSENTRGGGGGGGGGGGSAFSGTGHRLGETENDSDMVPASTADKKKTQIVPIKIRLWAEGFTIDDSDLRSYKDPENREFLNMIKRGEIPEELRRTLGFQAHVTLEDHHNEEYVKPIRKIKAFSGTGHMLGSPAPNTTTQLKSTATVASSSSSSISTGALPKVNAGQNDLDASTIQRNERLAVEEINVNIHEPTTMIQIRLADGSTYSGRFNHTHTIGDIRTYLTLARPNHTNRDFILLRSYPNKELSDDSQTIKDAELLNAAILQRFKN